MGCELSEVISRILRRGCWWVLGWAVVSGLSAQQFPSNWAIADARLAAYFEAEVRRIETNCMADVRTLGDWTGQREERRRQLLDMLGLWPLPARTDLKPVITGRLDGDGFRVEKLQFQSMPGLYVTGNLYLPKGVTGAVPAILYVCGHAEVKTNGVSLGNKTAYQHHGAWLAQHGYVCLVIDTLQLGEIQGDHHGTYRLGQWWWNARGYTPAGVEAWNSMRALDYLETRPEVDRSRFGMTGRSGGGSYTWTTAAVDERVKVAAPVAGMTDLRNHICDGAVEGHCDCMFFVNTHRWDFRLNAALFAPRPLLILNTDADNIFPLDGVTRLFTATRRIYEMYGAYDRIGLVIGPGPHKDSQNLQVPVLRWFNQHLRDQDPPVVRAAEKPFAPEQLRVLDAIPADQRNKTAQEFFGERLPPNVDSLETLQQLLAGMSSWGGRTRPRIPRCAWWLPGDRAVGSCGNTSSRARPWCRCGFSFLGTKGRCRRASSCASWRSPAGGIGWLRVASSSVRRSVVTRSRRWRRQEPDCPCWHRGRRWCGSVRVGWVRIDGRGMRGSWCRSGVGSSCWGRRWMECACGMYDGRWRWCGVWRPGHRSPCRRVASWRRMSCMRRSSSRIPWN